MVYFFVLTNIFINSGFYFWVFWYITGYFNLLHIYCERVVFIEVNSDLTELSEVCSTLDNINIINLETKKVEYLVMYRLLSK